MDERKDFLIQTRVPEGLDNVLKEEARRRRVTVSQLIRNVLHDSFELVDNVVANVDHIVNQSQLLARNVARDAQRVAASASGQDVLRPPPVPAPAAASPLAGVYGWQKLIMNRTETCAVCGGEMERGTEGLRGQSDNALAPGVWIHPDCLKKVPE